LHFWKVIDLLGFSSLELQVRIGDLQKA